jgi:repressor LexA
MPSFGEVATLFGYKSKNAASKLITKCIEEGFLDKDTKGKLIPGNLFNDIPVLGTVKAGFPSPAEEELQDTLSLNDYLIEKKEATYLLEVDGDSMIDAHITEGDMVIAERATDAKDGQIVIAEVDGEFTMKYLRKSGGKVWLEPANKKYKPIYPDTDLKITAIVKGIIRKY